MTPQYDPVAGSSVRAVEFRGAQRYRVLQRCLVRAPNVSAAEGWKGIVFSLSATGAGVTVPIALHRGAEVEIEPWHLPGAPPLKARVVHVSRLESVWLAGCELTRRLTKDELAAWLTNATAGL